LFGTANSALTLQPKGGQLRGAKDLILSHGVSVVERFLAMVIFTMGDWGQNQRCENNYKIKKKIFSLLILCSSEPGIRLANFPRPSSCYILII